MTQPAAKPASSPWWRHAMVWLVIAGPVAVVLASIATAAVAWRAADAMLPTSGVPAHRMAADEVDTGVRDSAAARTAPTAPALLARNHAAAAPR